MGYFTVYPTKKKKKLTKAELEAIANFEKLNKKWDKLYGPLTVKKKRSAAMPVLAPPPGRAAPNLPSKVTPGGSTTKKADNKYTGTKAIGVALMHKSNYAPVFEEQDAKDIARMRRC